MLYIFFAHAHARIRDAITHHNVLPVRAGTIAGIKANLSAVLGKLHRIAQNIHQNLPNPQGIRQHIACFRLLQIALEGDISVGQKTIGKIHNGIRHFRDIHRDRRELNLTAFNAADIQHIINKGQ